MTDTSALITAENAVPAVEAAIVQIPAVAQLERQYRKVAVPIVAAAEKLDPAIKADIAKIEHGHLPSKLDMAHGAAAFGASVLASSGALGLLSHFGAVKVLITSGIVGAVVTLLRTLA